MMPVACRAIAPASCEAILCNLGKYSKHTVVLTNVVEHIDQTFCSSGILDKIDYVISTNFVILCYIEIKYETYDIRSF